MKVSLKNPLFFTLFFCLYSTAQAAVVCSSLWANGYPEAGRTDSTDACHPFSPSITTLSTGQEVFSQNDTASDTAVKQRLEWASDALVYATAKYSAFASVPKIRMVYSERPYPGDAGSGNATVGFTYVQFFQLGREYCPIILYPASQSLSKEHFYQMVAHEIYHCVQKVNFPAQTEAAVRNTSEGMFWFESIAHFMSNDVYPPNNFEYHPMFGTFDQHLPFFEQATPYLAEGFFQGLFWHHGGSAARIHNTQASFGTSGATAVQDVMNISDVSEAFHKYARGISFNELMDSSGAQAPWRAERQIIAVPTSRTSSFSISFMDFATEPFEILFPKKGRYRLNIHRVDGSKLSIRKAGTLLWQESFDTTFVTDCDQDRKIEGIYTKASSELTYNTIRIDVERLDNETCPCELQTPPNDTCLYGSWQVDLETVKDFMRRLVGPGFQIHSASGGVKLTFTPGGEHSWDYQNLVVEGTARTSEPTHVRWNWNGIAQLAYTNQAIESETQICGKALGSTVQGQATMTVGGQTRTLPGGIPVFRGEGLVNYHCSPTTFTYEMMAGPIPFNWVFHRAP